MKIFEDILVVYTPNYKYLIKCDDLQNGQTIQELCHEDNIELVYQYEMSEHCIVFKEQTYKLIKSKMHTFDHINILLRDSSILREYLLNDNHSIMIGAQQYATIVHSPVDMKTTYHLLVNDTNNIIVASDDTSIYINSKSNKLPCSFNVNDIVDIGGVEYIFKKTHVLINDHVKSIEQVNLMLKDTCYQHALVVKDYRPGVRLLQPIARSVIEVESPISQEKMERIKIVMVFMPTIIMLCMTILSSLIFKRGLYMIIMVFSTISTSIFSYLQQRSSLKEKKKRNQKNRNEYHDYVQSTLSIINNTKEKHFQYMQKNFSDIHTLDKTLATKTTRVFERKTQDSDFLQCRIGTSNQLPPYDIKHDIPNLNVPQEIVDQHLQSVVDLVSKPYLQIRILCFKSQTIGFSGNLSVVYSQVKLYLAYLVFFHHPSNLNIIVVTDKTKYEGFSDFQYLSHFNGTLFGMMTCVCQEHHIRLCMDILVNIIKERLAHLNKYVHPLKAYPHIILLLTDIELVVHHPIYQFIQTDLMNISITVVQIASDPTKLLNATTCLLVFQNEREARLILDKGISCDETIYLDASNIELTMFIRKLASYSVQMESKHTILDKTSFIDIFDNQTLTVEVILNNWSNKRARNTLAAPIGLNNKNEPIFLDVHQNYSGPHGIIAGTTGSGKSELLQCYILSIACTFSPIEVGFLLIDYKGGGMAHTFESLPHIRGIITNLAFDDTERILKSLKAEIIKRQKTLNTHHINHIHQYQMLYDEGKIEIPMSNLIVIVDEFAELKNQVPELFTELISLARIGRSLGIHLILATQKPTGVVSEQMYANINFRICLRVQSESDSIEMISDRSAYNLTRPGSALIKSSEFVDSMLFQVGYVHANLNIEKTADNLDVFVKNDLGQYVDNISDKTKCNTTKMSQLDAVQSYVKQAYKMSNFKRPDSVFLQPLAKVIELDVTTFVAQHARMSTLKLYVGVIDIPHEQIQKEYEMNLDGSSTILLGQDGYGKSNFLKLITTILTIQNTPSEVCIYIVDMRAKLSEYRKLKQVADYIAEDDFHKAYQLERHIRRELLRRKDMLEDANVSNLSDYETKYEIIPRIILIIDMIDVVLAKESLFSFAFIEEILIKGSKYGIVLVTSALLVNTILIKLMHHFNHQLALTLPEGTNYLFNSKTVLTKNDRIPGRLIRLHETDGIIQLLLSLSESELKDYIALNQHRYQSFNKIKIPVVPKIIHSKDLIERYQSYEKFNKGNFLAIGIEMKTVNLELYNLESPFMCICANQHITEVLIHTLQLNEAVSFIDLCSHSKKSHTESTDIITLFSDIDNARCAPRQTTNIIYMIKDVEFMMSLLESKYTIHKVCQLLQTAYQLGYYFVVVISTDNMSSLSMIQRMFMTSSSYLVMNHRIMDSGIQVQQPIYNEKKLAIDQCYVIQMMEHRKIKLVDLDITSE